MTKLAVGMQEAAWFVTDEAIQIFGGMGYMRVSIIIVVVIIVIILGPPAQSCRPENYAKQN